MDVTKPIGRWADQENLIYVRWNSLKHQHKAEGNQ